MPENRTAVITGASSGVGAATALALAEIGMDVALVARRVERLEHLAARVSRHGRSVSVIAADLTDADAATRAMDEALRELGHVDVLVNSMGANIPHRALSELLIADWDLLVASNLSAIFYCVHALLPSMRRRGSGLIVSVSSMAGVRAQAVAGAGYSAAKAGLNMLSGCINAEEAANGIRSCVVTPGDIDTELLDHRPHPPTPEERAHMLRAEDVAKLILSIVEQPERALVEMVQVRPSPSKVL